MSPRVVRRPPPDEYSDWAYMERDGYHVEWRPCDPDTERLVDEDDPRKCRRPGCPERAAWELQRSDGRWWAYCADHHYGRRIRDGVLERRKLIKDDAIGENV